MKTKLLTLVLVLAVLGGLYKYGRGVWVPVHQKISGKKSVADVVSLVGERSRNSLKPLFEQKSIQYPSKEITFLAIKDESVLEVWANDGSGPKLITTMGIKAASGVLGPKLREGDRQVPEGIYRVIGLNPNSSYHLSMKLNYPNSFDLLHAKNEGRNEPGSDIFIHGKAVSIGCLAMGDKAIEQLFVLVHDVGSENTKVVIAPSDPRLNKLSSETGPSWLGDLYRDIELEFSAYYDTGT